MERLFNKSECKTTRKELRNHSTSAEAILWNSIKNSQLMGRKFRRQHSIGKYIMDFYCPSEKLAIELDGADHFTENGLKHDELRDNYIAQYGIKVLRVENKMVFKNHDQVLNYISDNFKIKE